MGKLEAQVGTVFDAQRFSLHDGPGLRTCLFFKGCGLKCAWCSNPESQSRGRELAVFADQCFACGDCVAVCEPGALNLEAGSLGWAKGRCDGCGRCAVVCSANAIQFIGEDMSAKQAFAHILRDAAFFRSGGGITLTGGEPALQPTFALAVLQLAREEGLHTAMETCGYVPWANYEGLLPLLDLVLFDLKHIDLARHKAATGVDNCLILENARRIAQSDVPTIIRVPLIPGFNANVGDVADLARFVRGLESIREVHLLPYHSLARAKYAALGRDYPMGDTPTLTTEEIEILAETVRRYGLHVSVGG